MHIESKEPQGQTVFHTLNSVPQLEDKSCEVISNIQLANEWANERFGDDVVMVALRLAREKIAAEKCGCRACFRMYERHLQETWDLFTPVDIEYLRPDSTNTGENSARVSVYDNPDSK